jgi:hypothetical protein
VRLPTDVADKLASLADRYTSTSPLGVRVGKATVAREAIVRGLPLLERELDGDSDGVDNA